MSKPMNFLNWKSIILSARFFSCFLFLVYLFLPSVSRTSFHTCSILSIVGLFTVFPSRLQLCNFSDAYHKFFRFFFSSYSLSLPVYFVTRNENNKNILYFNDSLEYYSFVFCFFCFLFCFFVWLFVCLLLACYHGQCRAMRKTIEQTKNKKKMTREKSI